MNILQKIVADQRAECRWAFIPAAVPMNMSCAQHWNAAKRTIRRY